VRFDPAVVDFAGLLEVFFAIHDPTTLDRQGNDVGSQYRSAIFFHDADQERVARDTIAALERDGAFADPIVTQVAPAAQFHRAEDYHDDYFARNPNQPYCRFVVGPKVEKFLRRFPRQVTSR
jgi:peptide-methionine (S)-S-oxide reductase